MNLQDVHRFKSSKLVLDFRIQCHIHLAMLCCFGFVVLFCFVWGFFILLISKGKISFQEFNFGFFPLFL